MAVTQEHRDGLRLVIIVVSVLVIILMSLATYGAYRDSAAQPPETRTFDDTVKASYPIRLDASRNLFQIGLLIAGGLWALLIGKTEETRVDLSQNHELTMFVLCNLCFLLSFFAHYVYTDRLSAWISSGVVTADKAGGASTSETTSSDRNQNTPPTHIEIPDIDAPRLTLMLVWQERFFAMGSVLSLITFLSGRYLRR